MTQITISALRMINYKIIRTAPGAACFFRLAGHSVLIPRKVLGAALHSVAASQNTPTVIYLIRRGEAKSIASVSSNSLLCQKWVILRTTFGLPVT